MKIWWRQGLRVQEMATTLSKSAMLSEERAVLNSRSIRLRLRHCVARTGEAICNDHETFSPIGMIMRLCCTPEHLQSTLQVSAEPSGL